MNFNPSDWFVSVAKECQDSGQLVDELAGLFKSLELSPIRLNIVQGILHPEVMIKLFVWRAESGHIDTSKTAQVFDAIETRRNHGIVKEIALGNTTFENPAFIVSPQYKIITGGADFIHEPLHQGREQEFSYPILHEFKASGGTDYLALPINFSNGNRGCLSILTKKADGFSQKDINQVQALMPFLDTLIELHASSVLNKTLLTTYLGEDPGEKVLHGKIKRGDVTEIEAAIWFSDIRGYTQLSHNIGSQELVNVLNEYFELVGSAIRSEGGEILKFIGDAVLAIFPVHSEGESRACDRALNAAIKANEKLADRNKEYITADDKLLNHGIALHVGNFQYGNIGSQNRLDFTVIGDAVNIAARVEGLCGKLRKSILMTQAFRNALTKVENKNELISFKSESFHSLKGVSQCIQVYSVQTGLD